MLLTPCQLHQKLPITEAACHTVAKTRNDLKRILQGSDHRLVVIIGPCSIHDTESAYEYALKLQKQIARYQQSLCIIMRTYFEKARTSLGWKGFINDPALNNGFDINQGLRTARHLLLRINALGVPAGAEIINPLTVPYFSDLFSWAAIGARTAESQLHRELASYLPMPVGFKNSTSGDIQVAIDAVQAAEKPHHFLHIDTAGKMVIAKTAGNPDCHIILRGSHYKINYDNQTIDQAIASLNHCNLINRVMVDCSHGNSRKNPSNQLLAIRQLGNQIASGDTRIFGIMSESHLMSGKQTWIPGQPLQYGQSITDACIGWSDTEAILYELNEAVQLGAV